jgi:hypothetical protein
LLRQQFQADGRIVVRQRGQERQPRRAALVARRRKTVEDAAAADAVPSGSVAQHEAVAAHGQRLPVEQDLRQRRIAGGNFRTVQ